MSPTITPLRHGWRLGRRSATGHGAGPGERSGPSRRPGPEPLPHDSWDSATTSLRRQIRRRPNRRYVWAALLLAAAALTSALLSTLLRLDGGVEAGAPTGATGSGARTPAASMTADPVVVTTAPPSVRAPIPGLPWPPLVVEAELGMPSVSLRRAEVVAVPGTSGGHAARFTSPTGRVQIRALPVPSDGRYRVTVTYAPGGAWSGRVRGSDGPVQVGFAAGTGCCATLTVEVRLVPGGMLSIEPTSGDAAFPAIDVVMIERI